VTVLVNITPLTFLTLTSCNCFTYKNFHDFPVNMITNNGEELCDKNLHDFPVTMITNNSEELCHKNLRDFPVNMITNNGAELCHNSWGSKLT
jgi:hypothetical protein